jgi:hypothetical protein
MKDDRRTIELESLSAQYQDVHADLCTLSDDQAAAQEHGDLELVEDLERVIQIKNDHLAYLSEKIGELS